MTERTLLDLFRHDVDAPRESHFIHYFPGGSRAFSTADFFAKTAALAESLSKLGIGKGDRVVVLADNRPEWHMVDLAVVALGAVDVPLYSTLSPPQICYQVNDSGATVAIVDSAAQMAKFLSIHDQTPALKHLVQMEGAREEGVRSLDEVIDGGRGAGPERFWSRAAAVGEDDLATIVYTSGTTGDPKGAMLTHRNFVSNVIASAPLLPIETSDLALEFLPLCHVYERCAGYMYMYKAASRAYCSTAQVGELIATIRPTVFCSVPRVFEKIYDKINAKVETAPPSRRKLFRWAVGIGRQAAEHRLAGTAMPLGLSLKHALADRVVLSKVRQAMGGRVKASLSGAAPLPRFINEFFHSLGISVQEGYGLTETSPVISANGHLPGTNRLGSVGRVLPNVEVRIAEDGELCARGPSIFPGYWNKPERTAEVFDSDGFFHTGDIARIDADGFIFITDRKKDLIITAGGKNVAPQPIENRLKQSRYVDSAVLVGDRRPFIVALFSPNAEELQQWAAAQGLPQALDELVGRPEVTRMFEEIVAETNRDLARYEQIKAFKVLATPFSVEGGQLTPTMKVKRRVVEREQADVIDRMYAAPTSEAM